MQRKKFTTIAAAVSHRMQRSSNNTTSLTSLWHIVSCTCFLLITISMQMHGTDAAAVMSVDLGTEWLKVGVVSPGVPMEIALNRESKRKTPAIIAFRDDIRTFGEDAVTVGIRDPAAAYGYLFDLLGKTIDNPIVDLYRERFPYYNLVADPERNTIIFKKSDTEQFSVEELIAQILVKAKEFAQDSTSQQVTECVITVPGYFGQAEREALLSAASLANLKVLQLINDYTAVALNYGVFHRAEINETAQYFIFYDMGAYKTSAALVSYQLVKDKHTKETNPVIQVLGVGYDRTLGGLEIQLRLRDYLASEFNAMKKTKTDVTKNPRALAKLFKEAGRLKNVLSANNDHYAQIENLIEDHDFRLQVTREKLEELCVDLWARVVKPLEQAVAVSGLPMDVVSQVILFGGGTRVPMVQETIRNAIKQEPGKSLNADEAATMGAVYLAADLATGFKVKKFILRDAVLFPIQVAFERDPGDGSGVKQVKRLLFGHMNAYPQRKVITFNKHIDDFHFYIHYGELNHLSAAEQSYLGALNITRVELQNVRDILEKNQKDIHDSKGIKAYFALDDSGLFQCTGVEYVYEKQRLADDGAEEGADQEGTLSKLGSTISKLFSKEADKKAKSTTNEQAETEQGDGSETDHSAAKDKPKTSTKLENETEEKEQDTNAEKQNKTTDDTKEAPAKNQTIKIVTIKEPMEHRVLMQITPTLTGEAYERSLEKLNAINLAEQQRNRLQSAFNTLESHVIETRQKLGEDEYSNCATVEEKEKILAECDAISDWLYEDVEDPTPEIYEKRLKELKALTSVFLARHWEHEERPEALKALDGMVGGASKFLDSAKNLTKEANPDKDIFTQVEIETLSKTLDDTIAWVKAETAAQKKLKRHDDVRLTVKDITDKMSLLDREVKYLVNKIKIWKPKVKPTKKSKKSTKKSTTATDGDGEGGNPASGEAEEAIAGSGEEAISNNNNDDNNEAQVETPEDKQEEAEVVDHATTTTPATNTNAKQTPKPSRSEKPTPRSDL